MRTLITLLLCLGCWKIQAQAPAQIIINAEGSVHPWNHLNVNNDPQTFQFAIVTDRTGGVRPGVFPVAVEKLNLLQPEFVMSVGDLITGYTDDTTVIDAQWDEFTGFIDQLEMPFFYVPGNHDYINDVMAYKWQERFGKDYYHFVYQDVLFVCLNSEEQKRGAGRGFIGAEQVAYLAKALEENPTARWTMLFMHQPLWDQEDNGQWAEAEKLLSSRKHSVFVGHRHRYVKYERNNGKYFILATTGGGSNLRGPRFGEFDHVVWVTMTESGPMIANLMLDGIWDENVNTEGYYAFAQPLMNGQNLSLQPIFTTENLFAAGTVSLKLQNPSDVPMVANLQFHSNEKLWAASNTWMDTLAPNSVQEWTLPIQTLQPTALAQIKPVRIEARYTYLPNQQPQLTVSQNLWVGPERILTLGETSKRIKVDADRKDWSDLPYMLSENGVRSGSPFAHSGPQDLSARFGLSYDSKALYFIAEVQDDQLELDATQSPYRQDGLYLLIDPRDKQLSSLGGPDRDHSLTIGISPDENGAAEGLVFRPVSLPTGTQTACKKTEKGYCVEIAVPMEWIEAHAGGDWKNLRFNLMLNDYDQKGAHLTRLYWRPEWDSQENRVGSGMFELK